MDINEEQQKKIEALASKYHLKLVLLFGSQSIGRIHKESDVDIAYLAKKELSFKDEYHLNYELTNIFQNDRVDTVNIRRATSLLLYAIFRHPKILFQEDELIAPTYQAYAFKKFIESKQFYQ